MHLSKTEFAFLQLAAAKPLSELSSFHLQIAHRLVNLGLVRFEDGRWYPTAAGLKEIQETLH